MKENLLLLFARNPEKGKVKTRLAKAIGDDRALAVYRKLLAHTQQVTAQLATCDKAVYFAEAASPGEQMWPQSEYSWHTQQGQDLGERMHHALLASFAAGYKRVVIIGTDCPELETSHLEQAFEALEKVPVVIGPAADGGYYLIGTSQPVPEIFRNVNWSTSTVLAETLQKLQAQNLTPHLLPVLSDIDELSDLERFPAFQADPAASIYG